MFSLCTDFLPLLLDAKFCTLKAYFLKKDEKLKMRLTSNRFLTIPQIPQLLRTKPFVLRSYIKEYCSDLKSYLRFSFKHLPILHDFRMGIPQLDTIPQDMKTMSFYT